MIGITTTTYPRPDKNVCDVDTVNKHPADENLAALGKQDKKRITSENVEVHAPKQYRQLICDLLRKHEDLWSGERGNIHANTHHIDLIPCARSFKFPSYRSGQKAGELEEFDIKTSTSRWRD